ncbi:hypothetical protein [Photorhabdus asymbiotica]|uniref:hypothetical protein n=1 Tax=Photorhabdus asymbiotica TaxID=291112 RepID=UPI003DA6E2F9
MAATSLASSFVEQGKYGGSTQLQSMLFNDLSTMLSLPLFYIDLILHKMQGY